MLYIFQILGVKSFRLCLHIVHASSCSVGFLAQKLSGGGYQMQRSCCLSTCCCYQHYICVCVCIRVYCARASIGVGLRGTSSPYTEERDKWQCSQILDNAPNIFRFLTINLLNKINSLIVLKSNVCHAGNLATEFLSLLCKDFGEKLTSDRGHFSSKEPQTAVNL